MLTTNLETNNYIGEYQNFSRSRTEGLKKIEQALGILGLKISDSQLNRLYDEKLLSLEYLTLSDLGTLLLLANAISSHKFEQKTYCFRDLLILNKNSNFLGIPLYCLSTQSSSKKTYLRLTFLAGNPAIVIQN